MTTTITHLHDDGTASITRIENDAHILIQQEKEKPPPSPPPVADVYATIAAKPYRISTTRRSMVIVDNNLHTGFAGATTQKQTALANLAGLFDHMAMFLESFGNGKLLPDSWNGVGDAVSDLPPINLTNWIAHWKILNDAIRPQSWAVYGWRLPWQLTENGGRPSTLADYSAEGRRLRRSKRAQYVEYMARAAAILMKMGIKIWVLGSEAKGFQTSGSGWAWAEQFWFFLAFRDGLMEGARRAGVPWSEIRIVTPYPVISHHGVRGSNSIVFDKYTDGGGNVVDFSDLNGDRNYPGWPNKAAAILMAEHFRLLKQNNIPVSEVMLGSDFGTYNNDNVPTANIGDHAHAYRRAKGHFAFYDKLKKLYGYEMSEEYIAEMYAKAQWQMQVEGPHFVPAELRDDYQASILFAFLQAAYEDGVEYPMLWSWIGRGGQSTDAANPGDWNQWHCGLLRRTVTDNNDHPGSAVPDGGKPQAARRVYAALREYFPVGTPLHKIEFSDARVMGLASTNYFLAANTTATPLTLSANQGTPVKLGPYAIEKFDSLSPLRPMTRAEMQEEFLRHILVLIDYYEKEERAPSAGEKLRGLAFSILVALDGEAVALPAWQVMANPHLDDQEYYKTELHRNWYVPNVDIAGDLHEAFLRLGGT